MFVWCSWGVFDDDDHVSDGSRKQQGERNQFQVLADTEMLVATTITSMMMASLMTMVAVDEGE